MTPGTLPGIQLGPVYSMDNAILPMLASMERNGVHIDTEFLTNFGAQLDGKINEIRYQIRMLEGVWPDFNPGSPDQVAELLYNTYRLRPGKRTGKGKYGTGDEILDKIKHLHPVIPLIQSYRGYRILKGTFVDGILDKVVDGRIHTNLNHAFVVSGRLSSSDPNLQNIPSSGFGKQIRYAFCAPPNRMLGVYDESQIELRIMADFSRDLVMLEAYNNGEDLHSKTGYVVGGYPINAVPKDFRTACKRFNFGIAYGISDQSLREQLLAEGIDWSLEQVAKFRQEWLRLYKGVPLAMESVWAFTRKHGYVVDIWGRPRLLPGVWSENIRIRSEAERQAFNHVIQGGAAGVIKLTMARLWREMPMEFKQHVLWLLQVHDELIAEIPDDIGFGKRFESWVLDIFKSTVHMSVPIFGDGKIARNWGEAKG